MPSGLRRVGEAVKAINENLLTCGCTRTRVLREGARVRVLMGRNEKEIGGEGEEGGGMKGEGGRSGGKGGAGREE